MLPFDLAEASFMSLKYQSGMSTAELLAERLRQLQKRAEDIAKIAETLERHRIKSKEQFEKHYETRLRQESYEPGTLVLVRNTAIEKEMNRKSKPRYKGPYEVLRQTSKGAYIIQELDGTPCRLSYAEYQVVPYISRTDSRLHQLAME